MIRPRRHIEVYLPFIVGILITIGLFSWYFNTKSNVLKPINHEIIDTNKLKING